MRGRLPRPLLVALGAATQVRRLPAALVQVPMLALTTYERARRTYDELALRGQAVVAGAAGDSDDSDTPNPTAHPVAAHPTAPDPVGEAVAHVVDPLDHPHPPPRPKSGEPVPGYDAMTLGALRGHLRTMTAEDLKRVLDYERAYLARPPMMTLVEHRIAKLAVEQGPA